MNLRAWLALPADGRVESLDQAARLQPAPKPITGRADVVDLDVRRRDRLGGILHEYENVA